MKKTLLLLTVFVTLLVIFLYSCSPWESPAADELPQGANTYSPALGLKMTIKEATPTSCTLVFQQNGEIDQDQLFWSKSRWTLYKWNSRQKRWKEVRHSVLFDTDEDHMGIPS